jgi:hypothetical protein
MLTVSTSLGIHCPAITINITFPHNGRVQVDLCTIQVLIKSKWKRASMQWHDPPKSVGLCPQGLNLWISRGIQIRLILRTFISLVRNINAQEDLHTRCLAQQK